MPLLWLLLLLVGTARADEYAAGTYSDRYDGYFKEARQTRIDYIRGETAYPTWVKRRRHDHWVEFEERRYNWWFGVRYDYPPDIIRNGQTVTVPLTPRILVSGPESLYLAASATITGIRNPERIQIVPARVGRRGDEPVVVVPGSVTFTPRLDWDAAEIVLKIEYADDHGTKWSIGEFHWWSNRQIKPNLPRRRDRDVSPP
jgi:hypothetical protein